MDISNFYIDYSKNKAFNFGLFSDIHIDSPGHDEALFQGDMKTCADKNARIYFNGDTFDGIMPTDRKRYGRAGDVIDADAQVNARVDYCYKKLEAYADYIDYIGFGNHEASIVKYNNTDVIQLLTYMLNQKRSKALPPIKRGGYVGFINLVFRRKEGRTRRFVIYRDHGKGGNSPVTRGMIGINRLNTAYVCDMTWTGHSHNSLLDRSGWTIGVTPQGKIYRKNQINVVTAGYQRNFDAKEYNDDSYYTNNFPEEKFYSPTALGYAELKLDLSGDDVRAEVVI